MMKNLSREYACALFELSEEENIENIILNEFREISQIFNDNFKYVEILSSYAVSKNEKIALLNDTFKSKINDYLLNFLKVIVENGHVYVLKTCFGEYENIYNKKRNILIVTAYTSVCMTQEQIKKLTLKLEDKTRKKVFVLNKIDRSIMGGIKIFYDTSFVDISLDNYFKKLSRNLETLNTNL